MTMTENKTIAKENAIENTPELIVHDDGMSELTHKFLAFAEAQVETVNAAIADDQYSEISSAKTLLAEAIEKLNKSVMQDEFTRLCATENPMLEAIKQGYITLYAVKNNRNRATGAESVELTTKENNVIDIVALEQFAKRKLFNNGQWIYWVEAFKYALYQKAGGDLMPAVQAKAFMKQFKLSKNARNCDMGANPASNASITKAMQQIFDGVLFIPKGEDEKNSTLNKWKIDNRDVKYIEYLALKRGKKKLSISLPKDTTIISLMTEVMHRCVIDGEYILEE